jgi:hypothetical protein
MNKTKQKKEDINDVDLFYIEKENRRKKREINKQKKDKYRNKDKWN